MERALVSAGTGVMNALVAKLAGLLEEEYKLVKGVRKEIESLKSELCAMKGVLHMLADFEELHPLEKSWRDTVREIAYDIEDCIDLSVHYRLSHADDAKAGFWDKMVGKMKKVRASHQVAHQMQELRARVVEESERRRRYKLDLPSNYSNPCVKVDPRMCALWVETERLVGIDGPRDNIIGSLMPETAEELPQQATALSIVGCGGLGKTTLANQVHLAIKGGFDCAAFVSVSQRPNIKDILMNICSQVRATPRLDNVQNLVDDLREYLQLKRYCVVVDDIWDSAHWDFIGAALVKNSPGSTIIITTRIEDVAESCRRSHGGCVHLMDRLGDSDCKRLFFTRIFGSEEKCPPELVQPSEEILSKCDGIPLAVTSISSFLAADIPQSSYHWNKVKECISSRVPGSKYLETMQSVLALSYFNLPHQLRSCLLYLSAFPEDCEIGKDRLVNRWIAEGFITAEGGESLYETGVRYFSMLINRSLIQPWREHNGEVLTCRVHDVILNFIVSRSADENFVTVSDPSGLPPSQSQGSKVRRLSVQNRYEENVVPWFKSIKPHARSLASSFVDCKDLHPLSEFEVLRVLDLEGCKSLENNHLANIQKLVQLRYLGIRGTGVSELPAKIGEVHHLETLDIRGTQVKEFPPGIVLLQRLVRLLVDSDVKFPAEGVSKMKALEELSHLSVFMQPLRFLKELGELTKLRVLGVLWTRPHGGYYYHEEVHEYEKIFASSLGELGKHNLSCLDFELCESAYAFRMGSLFPAPKTLRKLCSWWNPISSVPNWTGSLLNLEHLELCTFQITQDDLRALGGMRALEALALKNVHEQDRLVISSSDGFQRLKFLRMGVKNVLFMPGFTPNLKDLQMKLVVKNAGYVDSGIQHLPSLTKVHVHLYGSRGRGHVDNTEAGLRRIVDAHPNRPALIFGDLPTSH